MLSEEENLLGENIHLAVFFENIKQSQIFVQNTVNKENFFRRALLVQDGISHQSISEVPASGTASHLCLKSLLRTPEVRMCSA